MNVLKKLKQKPYDKVAHSVAAVAITVVAGPAAAIAYFYSREQHTAERYMHGVWQCYFFWLWKWEVRPGSNTPTVKDSQLDWMVTAVAAVATRYAMLAYGLKYLVEYL